MTELSSDESLEFQEQLLINDGCSQVPEEDQPGCAAGVMTWWRRMATVVYTPYMSKAICHALEPTCEGFGYKT